VEQNLAAIRSHHPGDQVDQRGLAGAIGADQRVAGAQRKRQFDRARDNERAKVLVEVARSQYGIVALYGHARLRQRASKSAQPPKRPLGRKMMTTISSRPSQKYQYCGFMSAS